jgi:hypothetical protein
VAAGARIVGDLRAPVVELAAGAVVEGRVDRVSPDAHPPGAADPAENKETVRLVSRPMKRPTRPPIPPPVRPPPPAPRPASRAKLVTRARAKTEDPK